jgi:hypothetical protein
MKRSIDNAKLVELLGRGVSQVAIASALGLHDHTAVRHVMRARGIGRRWTRCGVPVVEVRR